MIFHLTCPGVSKSVRSIYVMNTPGCPFLSLFLSLCLSQCVSFSVTLCISASPCVSRRLFLFLCLPLSIGLSLSHLSLYLSFCVSMFLCLFVSVSLSVFHCLSPSSLFVFVQSESLPVSLIHGPLKHWSHLCRRVSAEESSY